MKEFWNQRYSDNEYVYGETPNVFFKEVLDSLPVGKILLPADGEGRNGVYAAIKGWEVDAFDQSNQAREKALNLAKNNQVYISYQLADLSEVAGYYSANSYDAVALIFVHLPMVLKCEYHRNLISLLKKGGYFIIEGFGKKHVKHQQKNPHAGGPREEGMLYSKEEILLMFDDLEVVQLIEEETELQEGSGHAGKASVIRFVGKKYK